MARATLGFCGIETVAATGFSGVTGSSDRQRAAWLARARTLGGRRVARRRPWGHALARTAGTWLRALRLQFYPMTFVAYTVGALAAAQLAGRAPGGAAFWLGYAVLFWLEAATVFINDVFDAESDRRNDRYGPFTGGSRVLVEGRLSARALKRGAVAALVLAGFCVALLFAAAAPPPVGSLVAIGLLAAFALGYTLPPVKLSHRGLGELDVALTHSVGVLYVGYVLHAGPLGDPAPLWLALPMFWAVLAAITLSGIPDRDADRAAGKRTLVVKLGVRRAAWLAAGAATLAVALAAGLRLGLEVAALRGLDLVAGVHLLWLLWLLRPLLSGARSGAGRIDGPMAASLLFIAWFGLIPLYNLL
jgi:1,4-dihydroxy-2-naphthoate octaprenyltransferase